MNGYTIYMQNRPRRSQEQRKHETRLQLLDAAKKLLIERGMASLTTTAICKEAGLSQGALFKHFETKHLMLCAVAAHLYDFIVAEFEASMTALPNRPTLDETIEHLAMYFDSPQVRAVYDFHTSARVDAELRETLQECQQRHAENIAASALRLLPEYTSHPKFPAAVYTVIMLLQGSTVAGMVRRPPDQHRLFLDFIKDTARLWLSSPEEAS